MVPRLDERSARPRVVGSRSCGGRSATPCEEHSEHRHKHGAGRGHSAITLEGTSMNTEFPHAQAIRRDAREEGNREGQSCS
jgi:hypothetical protein